MSFTDLMAMWTRDLMSEAPPFGARLSPVSIASHYHAPAGSSTDFKWGPVMWRAAAHIALLDTAVLEVMRASHERAHEAEAAAAAAAAEAAAAALNASQGAFTEMMRHVEAHHSQLQSLMYQAAGGTGQGKVPGVDACSRSAEEFLTAKAKYTELHATAEQAKEAAAVTAERQRLAAERSETSKAICDVSKEVVTLLGGAEVVLQVSPLVQWAHECLAQYDQRLVVLQQVANERGRPMEECLLALCAFQQHIITRAFKEGGKALKAQAAMLSNYTGLVMAHLS